MTETWISRTSASNNNWRSVTYGNELFVAVSSTGTGDRVMTSLDGIVWTSQSSAADNEWRDITYGNNLFVAVSSSGRGDRVMTSPDGINWTSRNSAADNGWSCVTYGDGLFVAVSYDGLNNRVMTSPDGINWTSRTSASNNNWYSVTYQHNLFVAVASSGIGNRVMTSGRLSCYNKGTKILCLINNIETYIPIENIKKGFLVKTYKNGYLPVELIGTKTGITTPNGYNGNCLYKLKDGDLIVTGGHYLLVDELPNRELIDNFYKLNYTIEDKKILLVCDSDLFEMINEIQTCELYHIVLKCDTDMKRRYGIYVNGILSESTSKESFLLQNFTNTG